MMRLVRVHGVVEAGGREIDASDAALEAPDGAIVMPIVHEGMRIECAQWCSRDGTVWDRWYDPFADDFVWAQAPKSLSIDHASGECKVLIGIGAAARTVRLARAIAMAWLEAPPSAVALQARVLPHLELNADGVVWVRAGAREVEGAGHAADVEQAAAEPPAGARWKPLRYTWRDAAGQPVVVLPADTGYLVSADGDVRSPYALRGTRGHVSACQRRVMHVERYGALWVDEAVLHSFGADAATGCVAVVHANGDVDDSSVSNLRWSCGGPGASERYLPMLQRVREGASIGQLCADEGVCVSTMWSRIARVAEEARLDGEAVRIVRSLVPRSRYAWLRTCFDSGRATVATRVLALVDVRRDGDEDMWWSSLTDEHRIGIVRVLRALVVRDRVRERVRGMERR